MKKFSFNLFILTLLSFIIIGCNRSDADTVPQNNDAVPQKNAIAYGTLHNEALDLYYKNNPIAKEGKNSKINFSDAAIKITEYLKSYNKDLFANFNPNELSARYANFEKFEAKKSKIAGKSSNVYSKMSDLLEYLKLNNKISNKNYNFLTTSLLVDNDYNIKLAALNNYLSDSTLNEQDKGQMEVVKSIFISSNEYWKSSSNNRNIFSKGDEKSRAVICADAIGALIWSETGPGAIIGGAVCSLIANEGD